MKKWLWIIGGLVMLAVVAGYLYRDLLVLAAFRAYVKPSAAFAESVPPEAPDYGNPDHWAALPDRDDAADFTPEGVTDGQDGRKCGRVFCTPDNLSEQCGLECANG